jgi:hypothetical protein
MSKRNNKKGPTGSAVDKEGDALFVAPRRSPVRHHPSTYGDKRDPHPSEMDRVGDDGSFAQVIPWENSNEINAARRQDYGGDANTQGVNLWARMEAKEENVSNKNKQAANETMAENDATTNQPHDENPETVVSTRASDSDPSPGRNLRIERSTLPRIPPGAFFVRGPGFVDASSSNGDNASLDNTDAANDFLVSARLVQDGQSLSNQGDEEDGVLNSRQIVIATKVTLVSLLKDWRIQLVLLFVVLVAIGVIAWVSVEAANNKRSPSLTPAPTASPQPSFAPSLFPSPSPSLSPTNSPSELPSASPSLSPGRLLGKFCSLQPNYPGYGGDYCPPDRDCTSCPSPFQNTTVCFDTSLPSSVLQVYCTQLNETGARPCGNATCELENYCVWCEGYTPARSLEGHLCVDEDLDVGDFGEAYSQCVDLNTPTAPTGLPTLSPTGQPTLSPTGQPTSSEPTGQPTLSPTGQPTLSPTGQPTSSGPTG